MLEHGRYFIIQYRTLCHLHRFCFLKFSSRISVVQEPPDIIIFNIKKWAMLICPTLPKISAGNIGCSIPIISRRILFLTRIIDLKW